MRQVVQEANRAHPFSALRCSGLALMVIAEILALKEDARAPHRHRATLEQIAARMYREPRIDLATCGAVTSRRGTGGSGDEVP